MVNGRFSCIYPTWRMMCSLSMKYHKRYSIYMLTSLVFLLYIYI